MSIPTVNVTARVYDQSGKAVVRAVVTMRLTATERFGGTIVPREVRAETDATGKATLAVWPNELGTEKSEYRVHIKYPHNGCEQHCFNGAPGSVSGYAVVPNADCNLQDIMELAPYEYRGAGQVITSEVAMYAGQAAAARDQAQSLRDITHMAATRAEGAAAKSEAAAKKAGCASVAAQNHADRACQCAARAEIAADAAESAVDTVVEAARAAETSKICAEAAATNAEKSAREAAASKDEAVQAANGVKADAQAAKANADRAVIARNEAEGFRDEAGVSATAAAASATLATTEADRSQKYAEDTEAELIKIAVDLLVPQVVTDAVKQATDTATAAADTATAAAAEAAASAQEAKTSETTAKADADRADAACTTSEDIAGKMLKDYQVEVHMVELSAQIIKLSDFVTKHLLGHTGGGSLGGGTADAIDAAGEAVTLRVKELA